ncbi:MAG: phosphotransferase [Acidimicrobiales bacterium]
MTAPATPYAIDATWISEVLAASGVLTHGVVSDIAHENIGEGTGIFGEIVRLHLQYDSPEAGPASVVVKMPCQEPENLAVAQALGIYEREVRFFEEIAPSTELEVPRCYLAQRTPDGGFVLVLEDLTTEYEVGDQVVGATLEQAQAAIDALVSLHTRWWETDEVRQLDWLPVQDAPAYMEAVPAIYRGGLPVLKADWADRVPFAAIDLAERLDPRFEELMVRMGGAPQTFAHGDTRLDNIFFAREGTGVAFIDFQLSLRGRAVADLAYLIGTSVQTPVAREHWESLLRRWHEAVVDAGVDYSWDDAVHHYRECALFYLVGAMSLIGTFDSGNERGAAMTEAYLTRICNHVIDAETAPVLG